MDKIDIFQLLMKCISNWDSREKSGRIKWNEHWVRGGMEAWNQDWENNGLREKWNEYVESLKGDYRKHLYLPEIDFTNANLTKADLIGADLSDARLSGAKLMEARLTNASLRNANMTGANLAGANLINASGYPNLTEVNLYKAKLNKSTLRGANFTGAKVIEADLTEAILTRANFTNAIFANTVLLKASLGANFTGAVFLQIDFTGDRDFYGKRPTSIIVPPWRKRIIRRVRSFVAGSIPNKKNLMRIINYYAAKYNGIKNRADLKDADLTKADLSTAQNFILDGNRVFQTSFSPSAKDPYSILRRSYTGIWFFIILTLSVFFVFRHIAVELVAGLVAGWIGVFKDMPDLPTLVQEDGSKFDFKEYLKGKYTEMPIWRIVLGVNRELKDVLLNVFLFAYNGINAFMTFKIVRIRDAEERGYIAPYYKDYKGYWYIHKYGLRWIRYIVYGLVGWSIMRFLMLNIPIPK